MSLSSVCGRVAGTLSPLVTLLAAYHHAIPMLIYGVMPLIAAGFCLLLPETLNVELQDHAEVRSAVNPANRDWTRRGVKKKCNFEMQIFFPLTENLKLDPRGTKSVQNKLSM